MESAEFTDGLRRLERAVVAFERYDGRSDRFAMEVVSRPLYMQGGGYWGGFDDGLGRGIYRGEEHLEGEVWDISHPTQVCDAESRLVPQKMGSWAETFARFTNLDDPEETGMGLLECVVAGPLPGHRRARLTRLSPPAERLCHAGEFCRVGCPGRVDPILPPAPVAWLVLHRRRASEPVHDPETRGQSITIHLRENGVHPAKARQHAAARAPSRCACHIPTPLDSNDFFPPARLPREQRRSGVAERRLRSRLPTHPPPEAAIGGARRSEVTPLRRRHVAGGDTAPPLTRERAQHRSAVVVVHFATNLAVAEFEGGHAVRVPLLAFVLGAE